jgi:hypothetical protein
VQVIWTSVEQAVYDATPFDLPGPTETEVTQLAMAALNTNLPTTTITTANIIPVRTFDQNFEQFVSGITTVSDVQKELVPTAASPFTP